MTGMITDTTGRAPAPTPSAAYSAAVGACPFSARASSRQGSMPRRSSAVGGRVPSNRPRRDEPAGSRMPPKRFRPVRAARDADRPAGLAAPDARRPATRIEPDARLAIRAAPDACLLATRIETNARRPAGLAVPTARLPPNRRAFPDVRTAITPGRSAQAELCHPIVCTGDERATANDSWFVRPHLRCKEKTRHLRRCRNPRRCRAYTANISRVQNPVLATIRAVLQDTPFVMITTGTRRRSSSASRSAPVRSAGG